MECRHALAPFLFIESQRTLDCGCSALLIKGIDEKRLAHFGSGTRKFAQHQYSVTFGLAGNIFFCDHLIPSRGDPTEQTSANLERPTSSVRSIERLM